MLKAAGLLGLVLAAGLAGMVKAEELKSRIGLLEDFQNLLLSLKSQMNYFREPLYTLFSRTGKKSGSRAFLLPEACLAGLLEKNGEIAQIWAENTRQTYEGTALSEEDKEILCHIGTYLGQTDFANQQMQFQYTEERLAQQLAEAREIYRQKGPMYRRIGFFGGAVAALVLL
ncbi:MAG: stage III sporulation protein AB [Firmicutes bacterium]|nr:stage III sporulation protein AB [Bacillota bacterium]